MTITDLEDQKQQLSRSLRVSKSKKNVKKDGENAAKLQKLVGDQVRYLLSFLKKVSFIIDTIHF